MGKMTKVWRPCSIWCTVGYWQHDESMKTMFDTMHSGLWQHDESMKTMFDMMHSGLLATWRKYEDHVRYDAQWAIGNMTKVWRPCSIWCTLGYWQHDESMKTMFDMMHSGLLARWRKYEDHVRWRKYEDHGRYDAQWAISELFTQYYKFRTQVKISLTGVSKGRCLQVHITQFPRHLYNGKMVPVSQLRIYTLNKWLHTWRCSPCTVCIEFGILNKIWMVISLFLDTRAGKPVFRQKIFMEACPSMEACLLYHQDHP
jgi:hypothetical protein